MQIEAFESVQEEISIKINQPVVMLTTSLEGFLSFYSTRLVGKDLYSEIVGTFAPATKEYVNDILVYQKTVGTFLKEIYFDYNNKRKYWNYREYSEKDFAKLYELFQEIILGKYIGKIEDYQDNYELLKLAYEMSTEVVNIIDENGKTL